jgi:hypothetical protein
MNIEWSNRQAHKFSRTFASIDEARARLDDLTCAEDNTRRKMPTDSGLVRDTYRAEAAAIRAALAKAGAA